MCRESLGGLPMVKNIAHKLLGNRSCTKLLVIIVNVWGIYDFIPILQTFQLHPPPMSHWVNKYFLKVHYMPDKVVGARVNKTERTEFCGIISGKFLG